MTMHVSMSVSLKGYLMLKPSGPNFIRSKIIPCRKQRPMTSFFHGRGFLHVSKSPSPSMSSMRSMERATFARSPRGGSHVSLVPFCRIGTGKYLKERARGVGGVRSHSPPLFLSEEAEK